MKIILAQAFKNLLYALLFLLFIGGGNRGAMTPLKFEASQ